MSFHVFFDFSSGLAKPVTVPKGTKSTILAHVAEVERTLAIRRERNGPEHPEYWSYDYSFGHVADEVLCKTVSDHNRWVRWLYGRLACWSQEPPSGETEELTPAEAESFWPALRCLPVSPDRWTNAFYRERMEHLYEVMRGRASEGVTFDAKALAPKQAAAVIRIFDRYLDPGDLRLDVPFGHDRLASSYDGGYDWCDKCFRPIAPGDEASCRRRQCPLQVEEGDD